MEIYEHDKTHKAYYVFPYNTRVADALDEVAKEKHISRNKLKWTIGKIEGNELTLGKAKTSDNRVIAIYKTNYEVIV